MEKKWFIGIDVSKDTLDVAMHSLEAREKFTEKKFDNDLKGYGFLISWIRKKNIALADCVFCLEHTGVYSLTLVAYLNEQNVFVSVEPALQIKQSMGMVRGKNDKVDARRIAIYAMDNCVKLKGYKVPGKSILKIKQLLTYRDQLTRMMTSFKNSLKSHERFQMNTDPDFVTVDIQMQLEDLQARIEKINQQIEEIIIQEESLKTNYDLLRSVKGIGFVIAAFMLVSTVNFERFDDGRKYACYAGVAPFEHSSGTSIRGKSSVSFLANKRIKTLLYNAANSASQWDPELKTYYQRKRNEGKDHQLVMNAVCCKLVYRMFAVIKRKTPFVSSYKENFSNVLHES
jgi:transposase